MKTSNKLLIAFLLVAFLSSFVLFFSFKKAIKENRFTYENYGQDNKETYKLAPYKYVKIISPSPDANLFKCNIFPSAEAKYMIPDYFPKKYFSANNQGDTLVLKYEIPLDKNGIQTNRLQGLSLDLYLPNMENLYVFGVGITIDSVDVSANPLINIWLSDNAGLTLGRGGRREVFIATINNKNAAKLPTTEDFYGAGVAPIQLGSFNIQANNSKIYLGHYSSIKNLQINTANESEINIEAGTRIDTLRGSISAQTTLNAPAGTMPRLIPLLSR